MLLLIDNYTNIDPLNYKILLHLTIFETILLSLTAFVIMLVIYIAVYMPVHWNLRFIIIVLISQYYLSLISRLLILAVQMEVIPFEGTYETSKLVLLCSLFRFYYFSTCCGGIISIIAERAIASILMVDYETKFRRYIGIGLSVLVTISSSIATFLVTFEYVPWSYIGLSVISGGVSSTVFFVWLLWRNQRRYNRIVLEPTINNETTIKYTLSLRFQLNENIRSMKLLRNVVILCTSMHVICFAILTTSRIDWMHSYSDIAGHYLDAILNMTVAMYALLLPLVAYCSADAYRNLARSLPFVGRLFRESKVASVREISEEGNVYFNNLNRQWG